MCFNDFRVQIFVRWFFLTFQDTFFVQFLEHMDNRHKTLHHDIAKLLIFIGKLNSRPSKIHVNVLIVHYNKITSLFLILPHPVLSFCFLLLGNLNIQNTSFVKNT